MYSGLGARVQALILSDGGLWGVPATGLSIQKTRQLEASEAAKTLGCLAPRFGNWPDRSLVCNAQLIAEIVQNVKDFRADTIFAPSPWEIHPDHQAVAMAALAALLELGDRYTLIQYEVGSPLLPNRLVDITPVGHLKQLAMSCFASQLAMQNYDKHIHALNVYRTYTLPPAVTSAEAFCITNCKTARTDPFGLVFQGLPHPVIRNGLPVLHRMD